MIIPNQDKVKSLLLLQLEAQVPEEEQIWIEVTISKQKNQELGMISIMQPLQSVQMPIIKYKEFLCWLLTALPNQYLMLRRDWTIKNLRIQINKSYFFNVLHPFGTETYVFLLGKRKSIVIKPIYPLFWQQFNIWTDFFRLKMMKALTMNPQMTKMNIYVFRTLQRPPSSQKFFLERFLTVQISTRHLKWRTTLSFVFVHVQIHPNHGGKKEYIY